FENEDEWDFVKAAVDGSSYYKLPKVLEWLTGSIGYHHVHHLSPRVPNYKLEEAHESTPPLKQATTITLTSSLKSRSEERRVGQGCRFRKEDDSVKNIRIE